MYHSHRTPLEELISRFYRALQEQDALDNVKWIAEHGGVDFIEISGGDYERPGTDFRTT
jgi:hypothetical protein